MERKITVGYWYIVGGPAGATVTVKGEENPCCTVPEGGQGCFFAQAPVVIVSDEAITLSQVVNFKCAPVKRWLIGLGRGVQSVLPRGYLEAEFLESTGGQTIETDYIPNNETGIRLLLEPTTTQTGTNLGFPAGIRDSGYYFFPPRPTPQIGYGWNSFYKFGDLSVMVPGKNVSELNYLNSRKAKLSTYLGDLGNLGFTPTIPLWLFSNNGYDARWKGRIFTAEITQGEDVVRKFVPVLDHQGVPCFFDKVTKQAFLNKGGGAFIVGMNMKQALKLSKLPAGGGSLTVSLPWEAQLVQHNAEVEAALQTAKSNGWTITVQHREPEADSAVYNKYAACTTFADMATVNLNWKQDITVDKSWLYPMPALVDSRNGDNLSKNMSQVPVEFFYLYWPNAKEVQYALKGNKTVKKVEWHTLNNTVYAMGFCVRCDNLEEVVGTCPKLYDLRSAMQGCKKLKKWGIALPYLHWGGGAFDGTILDKESALLILNSISIPIYFDTGNLTLGIHIDHQTDDEVLAAIADAEAKNWNLTVQWNGTPSAQSASTYGLRKPTIYAKLGTLERPDGTTVHVLDWGHYVTEAEANGYQEFGSVEEAKEYFNIGD